MVVYVDNKISKEDLNNSKEEYGEYIKVVVDVEKEVVTIGGEWHADGEKILLEKGSKQKNLWGGGIDLFSGKIETLALINLRPKENASQDILDGKIREKFIEITKVKFKPWIGNKH